MRNELENIEKIEKYLRNELNSEDKVEFEEQLKTDSSLRKQVDSQKDAVNGIKRLGVKDSIQKAYKKYKIRKAGFRFGLGSVILLAIVSSFLWNSTPSSKLEKSTPKIAEVAEVETEFVVPKEYSATIDSYKINPRITTKLKIGSEGTVLHIPEMAFIDDKGKPITSMVTITFQEFKNSADMAFSQIPMNYTKGNIEYNFNSSGMFSIKGYSEGKEISINPKKPLYIDYALAKQNDNIDFYRLKDDSTNWDFIEEIDELENKVNSVAIVEVVPVTRQIGTAVKLDNANDVEIVNWHMGIEQDTIQEGGAFVDNGNRSQNTMLAPGMGAGHTYPPIIAGLNISSFGVYNCDQIYRLPNRVNINSTYEDEQGKKIEDVSLISLIDLNYNGAFSFDASSFTCDSRGDNVILLFTKSGELYLLEKGNFEKMKISNHGAYTFKMKNVSKTIKNTEDLKTYLNL